MSDVNIDTGLKSNISYTPTVTEIAALILAAGAAEAVEFSRSKLIGLLDWEIDTTSKRFNYTITTESSVNPYFYEAVYVKTGMFDTLDEAVAHSKTNPALAWTENIRTVNETTYGCYIYEGKEYCDTTIVIRRDNPEYLPPVVEDKSFTIDAVATDILANSAAGNAASQNTLTHITINKFANDEFAAELDANATPFS